ncbi:MAG: PKD domain-containing protein [Flavobacteriales bacterium]|nr:PKD domain-containing protein [Flavobacteriales bacterium]
MLTNGPRPDTACLPLSSPTIEGFGIVNIAMNGLALPSDDAVADGGYLDRSCILDTVEVGSVLELTVTTGTIATHQIKAWVDWDSSGVFTPDEVVLALGSGTTASASLIVPGTAVQNAPLRLRVMADYDLAAALDPCVGPQFGQAEDLALVIIANPDPPIAQFTATPLFTCDGEVQFSDASLNLATGWTWDFGDLNGSTDASPQHTYLANGIYTVTLIAINANGGDTLTLTDLITVDLDGQLPPAQCTPGTQTYCCGYGLLGITFAGINSTSVDGAEGYQDRSCGQVAQVEEGSGYPIALETDDQNDQDAYVWIDLDNDGLFAASELVFFALGAVDPSGTVAIPQGTVYNTPLRMRVITDVVGEITGPCDAPLFGQAEDFTVVVSQITAPPTAQFIATPTTTCNGVVQFTDASTALPNSWLWDFGDFTTSTDQDPLHTYAAPGTYTVTLTVTNPNGNDTDVQTGLINYLQGFLCDTTSIPDNGQLVLEECQGIVMDDGGVTNDYSPGVSGSVTIAPPGAETITLLFDQFAFETDFDFLALYDGPSVNAPLLAELSGANVGDLPNGGVFTSSGPALTIRQEASNGPTTWEGFVAQWDCSLTGIGEASDPIGSVGPVPARDVFHLNLAAGAGDGWWVTINNALGELVTYEALPQGARGATFDAAPWPSGCYGLSVHSPDGVWSRLIVVQR